MDDLSKFRSVSRHCTVVYGNEICLPWGYLEEQAG